MRLADFAEVRDRIADMQENVSTRWRRWQCQRNGHPGIAFYNPGGLEPDYHCTRCGEDTA